MQKYDFPKIILSDEGKEFLGEFEAYLKRKGIKQMQSKSYTPQPNIEATNGVLRNLIRAQFIKNKSLIWKDHCDDMMKSKNSNRDKVTGQPAVVLMREYIKGLHIDDERERLKKTKKLALANEKRKTHKKKLQARVQQFKGQRLNKGDMARVRLANFLSAVRDRIKAGDRKRIVVRFSPEVYVVEKVIEKELNNLYILKTKGGDIIRNEDDSERIFHRNDLLKVPVGTRELNMTLKKANYLNRVKDDGSRARDLYIKKVTNRTRKRRRAKKPVRDILEDPVKNWGKAHWEKVLLEKEFDDKDELGHVNRMVIYKIVYVAPSEGYGKSYKVHYVKKGEKPKKKDEDDEWIYIQWFAEEFPEIRKEDWYKEKREQLDKVRDPAYREDWRHPDPELRDL